MDQELAWYIYRYFGQFMTHKEHAAGRHFMATQKATGGRSDRAAQQEARKSRIHAEFLSNDPEVLDLALDGFDAFVQGTAERILAEHGNEIQINRCPRCGKVAKTPKAKQCRFCHFDWHGS